MDFIGRFQFRPVQHTRAPARKIRKIKLAERGGFEQSQSNPPEANLQSDSANGQVPASLTASQKPDQACPELAEFSQAWPKLPEKIRTAILALIRATLNPTTK